MTGRFTVINDEQCAHYARFLRKLNLAEANALFWSMFFSVLFLMIISSIQHQKSTGLAVKADLEKALTQHALAAQARKHKKLRQRWLGLSCICFIVAVVCAIIECFALFNIEYCDGEDLMQLYWGFWSVLTVGSLIAILGVIVQFWIVLSSVETPSWAVALGTPVLVFAAIGWIWRHFSKRVWGRCLGHRVEGDSDDDDDDNSDDPQGDARGMNRWLSRAPTIVVERSESTSSREPAHNNNNKTSETREGLRRTSTF